ncbi:DUF1842 domain-containing protein [Roseibium algae]|uniref:DUF1842 domain-containing protein n=1 Tax=Roseibium algae TaxID=3123038 RepID=A0ABU8TKC4_9HYPH
MSGKEEVIDVGLFLLRLKTDTGSRLGAASNDLTLTVSTPNQTVSGHSSVTWAVSPPVDVQSHVTGVLIYETVMPPGESKIRIDLSGWPEINWPINGGVGPVIPQNYKSIIILKPDYSEGFIVYQFRTDISGKWIEIREKIKRV